MKNLNASAVCAVFFLVAAVSKSAPTDPDFDRGYARGHAMGQTAHQSIGDTLKSATTQDIFGHTISAPKGIEQSEKADPFDVTSTIKNSRTNRLSEPLKTKTQKNLDAVLASYDARDAAGSAAVAMSPPSCTDTPCTTHDATPSKDFDRSVAALSAIGAAGQSYHNGKHHRLFGGVPQHCRDIAVGYSNCCQEKGWGQAIDLAHCSATEKKLGRARQSGRTIALGRYCKHRVLSVCTEHAQVFCVFPSRMATIIQSQGRLSQLKKSLGTAQKPDCSGLSVEEFSTLDLGQIDFSALYADVRQSAKIPDTSPIDIEQLKSRGAS